jgi:hypothetical protein
MLSLKKQNAKWMHMDMLIDLHTSRPYFEVFQFRIQVIQKIEQEV